MGKWGMTTELEEQVKKKYKRCVYCQVKLKKYAHTKRSRGNEATLEHIDNDGPNSEANVVMCCRSCNASKGPKKLTVWFESPFCKERKINKRTVASVVRKHL